MNEIIQKRARRGILAARRILDDFSRVRGGLQPPVPIHAIADWLGLRLNILTATDEECSLLVCDRAGIIESRGTEGWHRQRLELGCRLAQILLEHPFRNECTEWERAFFNAEAEECAGELLVPAQLLRRWTSFTCDTAVLADLFDVSEDLMRRRLDSRVD